MRTPAITLIQVFARLNVLQVEQITQAIIKISITTVVFNQDSQRVSAIDECRGWNMV